MLSYRSCKTKQCYGGLAQLGERLPCKQEVTSSNLVFSTRYVNKVKIPIICTLKTAHRKFFFRRKATSDFYDKKEFLYNCSATLDYGCDSILHLDSSERHITKNITKAASKQAYAVLFRFCCMAEQLSKILPIASRKTKT